MERVTDFLSFSIYRTDQDVTDIADFWSDFAIRSGMISGLDLSNRGSDFIRP